FPRLSCSQHGSRQSTKDRRENEGCVAGGPLAARIHGKVGCYADGGSRHRSAVPQSAVAGISAACRSRTASRAREGIHASTHDSCSDRRTNTVTRERTIRRRVLGI